MAGILPTVAALCGPSTKMEVDTSFTTCLNMNMMGIAAPGRGKPVVYDLITDTADKLESISGKNVLIDTYSAAGLQTHQRENHGYALLTSDDGQRILSSTPTENVNTYGCPHNNSVTLKNRLKIITILS